MLAVITVLASICFFAVILPQWCPGDLWDSKIPIFGIHIGLYATLYFYWHLKITKLKGVMLAQWLTHWTGDQDVGLIPAQCTTTRKYFVAAAMWPYATITIATYLF